MKYKAFEDYYKEANIKHLVLIEYKGRLVSPPFATEHCKDYSKILVWYNTALYIDLDLPPATSKFNGVQVVGDSLWMIPYGIWDDFRYAVELNDYQATVHELGSYGKGQYYSLDGNNDTAFSFPLGYEGTDHCLLIKDNKITQVEFPAPKKAHMGTVYCNQGYWSPPRSDDAGYTTIAGYRDDTFISVEVALSNKDVTRKYSDFIAKGNMLYALPFGETAGVNEIIEFNTETLEYKLYPVPSDFAKKYNAGVLVGDVIIAVPYGDEHCNDSNIGIVFNTVDKTIKEFDIALSFGGKYRFRCGQEFNQHAVFFPTGTPLCPILVVDQQGNIKRKIPLENYLLGRPIKYKNKLATIAYELDTQCHYIMFLDSDLNLQFVSV